VREDDADDVDCAVHGRRIGWVMLAAEIENSAGSGAGMGLG
jgi:hypothetical protein